MTPKPMGPARKRGDPGGAAALSALAASLLVAGVRVYEHYSGALLEKVESNRIHRSF
ncbi:hypothetical protein [Actinomadura sp. 7K534]|uniref:hypothetical protein n=1 Tax=Actinomadura sp. 7K534 TaxID=2530366 RepID=UPI001404712C|nr:hypothetical protein [Actinomadura sp. 7K534]